MNKLLLSAALAAGVLSAPAHAGLNSGDWANILGAVVEVAGAAAAGYAAAQQQQQPVYAQPQTEPTIFYTGYYINAYGTKVCKYTDGSELAVGNLSQCPAWF